MQNVGTPREGGTDITDPVASISAAGAADIVATLVTLIGLPGDFGVTSTVYARPPPGGWGAPQRLATFDARLSFAPLTADLVSRRAGDALYVAGEARGPMAFFGNLRGSGSASFGPRVPILSGPGTGEIRAGALAAHRFLTVLRLNGVLQSWTQTGAAGFADPRTIIRSGALRLLDADASADGEGLAVWQLDTGPLQVALYDDAGRTPAPGVDRTRPVCGACASHRRASRSGAVADGQPMAVRRSTGA
jgi:hypothetical protein